MVKFKQTHVQNLAVVGDVLAGNHAAALTFRDAESARDVLRALRAEPNVTAACVYTSDGKPFAKYARDSKDSNFVPPPPQAESTQFKNGHLVQFRNIVLAGETIGTLYLESDLERLHSRLRAYASNLVLTLLVAFSLAFALASRFQKPISEPVLNLVETTKVHPVTIRKLVRGEARTVSAQIARRHRRPVRRLVGQTRARPHPLRARRRYRRPQAGHGRGLVRRRRAG